LHRFALATCGSTLLLIVAGGLVTSTRSGLAVPDWPLSFGQFFPAMRGGVLFEHGHRMIAGAVSFLIAAQLVWVLRREQRSGVRWLAGAAALAVVLQAVLGGVTVLLKLPPQVSVAHASLAQGVFCLTLAIALATSEAWKNAAPDSGGVPARIALRFGRIAFVLLYLQLVLGAILRHTGSALPLHVVGALAASGGVLALCAGILRERNVPRPLQFGAQALALLLFVQVTLGVTALAAGVPRPVSIATAHVAVGALLLATTLFVTLWGWRLSPPAEAAPARAGATA